MSTKSCTQRLDTQSIGSPAARHRADSSQRPHGQHHGGCSKGNEEQILVEAADVPTFEQRSEELLRFRPVVSPALVRDLDREDAADRG